MLGVSRAEGDPGLITRFKVFRRSLTVTMASKISNPGASGLQGSKGSKHVGTYP